MLFHNWASWDTLAWVLCLHKQLSAELPAWVHVSNSAEAWKHLLWKAGKKTWLPNLVLIFVTLLSKYPLQINSLLIYFLRMFFLWISFPLNVVSETSLLENNLFHGVEEYNTQSGQILKFKGAIFFFPFLQVLFSVNCLETNDSPSPSLLQIWIAYCHTMKQH